MSQPYIQDESPFFLGNVRERQLTEIEGVPNATYLVENGRVFVFKKLFKESLETAFNGREFDHDLVRSLLPGAYVTPLEAIRDWGIEPGPWRIREDGGLGGWTLHHQPFNARIPVVYDHKPLAEEALAEILVGGILEGEGQFSWQGQPLVMREPMGADFLPPRPMFADQVKVYEKKFGFLHLRGYDYMPGVLPLSEEGFKRLAEFEKSWDDRVFSVCSFVNANIQRLWAMADSLPLAEFSFGYVNRYEPREDMDDLVALRRLYPELSMLSNAALYWTFNEYMTNECLMRRWDAHRDDSYLPYLLGKVALKHGGFEALGDMVSCALLCGYAFADALGFGRRFNAYHEALSGQARTVSSAFRFARFDGSVKTSVGKAIYNKSDDGFYRVMRKYGPYIHEVRQDLSDFPNPVSIQISDIPKWFGDSKPV